MGQTKISGRCYGLMRKNGEDFVVDFACAKCRHVGILHNLTNIRRKASAGFGLHVDRVPVAYHRVIKARFTSIRQFEKKYANTIRMYQFNPGDLILVQNSCIEASLDRKTKPQWIDPMAIVWQTSHRAYILAEMDSAISKLHFATFHVIPYHAHQKAPINLETFFVLPDTNEEMEDERDETDTDEDIQDEAGGSIS
jgi:hypothetical protein